MHFADNFLTTMITNAETAVAAAQKGLPVTVTSLTAPGGVTVASPTPATKPATIAVVPKPGFFSGANLYLILGGIAVLGVGAVAIRKARKKKAAKAAPAMAGYSPRRKRKGHGRRRR